LIRADGGWRIDRTAVLHCSPSAKHMNWLYIFTGLFFISLTAAFYYFVTRDTNRYRKRVEERL